MKYEPLKDFSTIFICSACRKEIDNLFGKDNSSKKQYLTWLDRQLRFLDSNPISVLVKEYEAFEDLHRKSADFSLYSLRRPHSNGNPRVLFAAIKPASTQTIMLLLSFKELNSSDYDRYIPIAESRMKAILDELEKED